jgi:hypothetical protein
MDSMAARTGSPYFAVDATSLRRASASGETAVTSFVAPLSSSKCTSSLFRDRSKPAYNISGASFPARSADDTWSVPSRRPLFMAFSPGAWAVEWL